MHHSARVSGLRALAPCALLAACGPLGSMNAPALDGGTTTPTVSIDAGAAPQGTGAGASAATALAPGALSNEAIMTLVRDAAYRGDGFVRVDRTPFVSTVSPDKKIALYISKAGYDAYAEISPDAVGSDVSIPVGTVIVREVWGGSELAAITLMVQLEKGAFPLGGDFWYASLSPDGKVNHDAQTGEPQMGLSDRCGTCHLRRSDDAYLFGVPTNAQQ